MIGSVVKFITNTIQQNLPCSFEPLQRLIIFAFCLTRRPFFNFICNKHALQNLLI